MKKILLLIISAVFFYSAQSQTFIRETEAQNTAIKIAIEDFLRCRLCKNHNVFSVNTFERGEYDRYEISDKLITVSILPKETSEPQYYITLVDTVGSTRLPTRYIIKNGKLFYWHDSEYGLTEETIKLFLEFKLAEPLNISDLALLLGQEVWGDGKTKGMDYYFCKTDLNNYKRIITSFALGWYKPPKIKCK